MNIYKPIRGENTVDGKGEDFFRLRPYMKKPGAMTSREIAAFRLDEHLGFGRIPPTGRTKGRWVDGRSGAEGMVQKFVESTFGRKDIHAYPEVQQQQMAVLDYVMGNIDRHPGNYRSVQKGDQLDVVAIDHGRSFPHARYPLDIDIRSEFVREHRGKVLDDDILHSINNVDQESLRAALTDAGLSDNAVNGALARLNEINATRMIPGDTIVLGVGS
ncbi:hypothetical protein [Nocardia sp. NPDC051463]|uniref:hypothetical protein n=1 Tax=Nocardia sp. NPDC051463 TaxID=3154845 RepID=UPI00344E84E3